MNIFRKAGSAVEHIWASYPFIGIIVLFLAIGLGVFEAAKARQVAGIAASSSQQSNTILQELKRTQQDAIAAKNGTIDEQNKRLIEKDSQIATLTVVDTNLYNDALALQQQVIMLGGKPKPIPINLSRTPSSIQPSSPTSSSVSNTVTTTITNTQCKLGLQVAPLNIAQVQICIPPKG